MPWQAGHPGCACLATTSYHRHGALFTGASLLLIQNTHINYSPPNSNHSLLLILHTSWGPIHGYMAN